jgi:hypothetical protein
LSKLAGFLVAEGVVDDISHEGLRMLLREEGVTFQRLKTWKAGKDPDYAAKKARIEHLYAIADREVTPEPGEPQAQLTDITALRDDAAQRGWHTEVARHSRVIASIRAHLQRLQPGAETRHNG